MNSFQRNIYRTQTEVVSAPVQISGNIEVRNLNANGIFVTVEISQTVITLNNGGAFPVQGGATVSGSYSVSGNPVTIIRVTSNNATDAPVRLNVGTNPALVSCQLSTGDISFNGIDLSTNPSISITLDVQGTACS